MQSHKADREAGILRGDGFFDRRIRARVLRCKSALSELTLGAKRFDGMFINASAVGQDKSKCKAALEDARPVL